MPLRTRDLPFRKAFIGPPIPRDHTGAGCPDWQNLVLDPSGATLRPAPGFRRTYPYDILQSGDAHANSNRVVSFPPQALLTSGGRGIGIVDEVTGREIGLAYHPGGVNVDPAITPAPTTLGYLNRQGPHDYPTCINQRGLTQIHTPFDEPHCFDGATFRKDGIRAPQRALTLSSTGGSGGFIDDIDQNLPTSPLYNSSQGNNIILNPASYSPVYDDDDEIDSDADDGIPGYNHIRIRKAASAPGDLAWRTYASPQTLLATVTRMSIWLYYWAKKKLNSDASAPVFYMVFDNTVNFTGTVAAGTRLEFPIVVHNRPYAWTKVEKPVTIATNFTYSSFGIRLAKTIPEDHFRRDEIILPDGGVVPGADEDDWVKLRLDGIRFFNPTEAADEDLVQGQPLPDDKYVLAYTWYDPTRFRESNLSPYSPLLYFGDNVAFNLDVTGYYPRIPAGLQNAPPDTTITKVRIYIHRLSWGSDNPANPAAGRPQFHLLIEADLPAADIPDGRRIVSFTNQRAESEILVDVAPPYENDSPPAAQYCVPDGNRLVLAGIPSYSVGRVSTVGSTDADGNDTNVGELANIISRMLAYTNDTSGVLDYYATSPGAGFTISPENTPVFGPHLEGRDIRIEGDSATYLIIKALDSGGGVYDKLYIGRDEQEIGYPATLTKAKYLIGGNPNRIYYTYIGVNGVNQEAVPLFNYSDIEFPGDEITGLGHAGDFLVITGRRHVAFLLQDTQALDDLAVAGNPYPNPRVISGSPGCVSGRTIVQLPNRNCMWLAPDGKLVLCTPGSVDYHPLSEFFRGWIASYYRIDESSLRFSHAVYDRTRNWYALFPIDAARDSTNAGSFAEWPDAPPPDPTVAFGADTPGADTELYCTPWEDYGSGGIIYNTHILELDNPGLPAVNPPMEWLGRTIVMIGGTTFSVNATTPTPAETWVARDPDDPTDADPFGYAATNFNRFTTDQSVYHDGGGAPTPIAGTQFINAGSDSTWFHYLHPDIGYITCRMRCNRAVPAGAWQIRCYDDFSNEYFFTSNTALVANTWTYVTFTPDDPTPGVAFRWTLMDLNSLNAFNAPGQVILDIANGRQIEGYDAGDVPAELPWYGIVCQPYGAAINRGSTLTNDFARGLIVDLNLNTIYPLWGYSLTTTLGNSSPCAGAAQLPDVILAGTTDGRIVKLFTDDAPGLGTPMERCYWPILSATTTVLTIDPAALETFFASQSLNFLTGLHIRVFYTSGAYVDRICSTNTTGTITLSVALSTAVGVAYILIAPMLCGVLFGEARYTHPAVVTGLMLNCYDNQVSPQLLTLNIYGRPLSSASIATNLLNVIATHQFLSTAQNFGTGETLPPRAASKTLSPSLTFNPHGGGTLTLGPIRVTEALHPAELPRSTKAPGGL